VTARRAAGASRRRPPGHAPILFAIRACRGLWSCSPVLRRAKLKIARISLAAALALLAVPVPAAVAPSKPPADAPATAAPAPAPPAVDEAKPADTPEPAAAPAPAEAPKRSAADLGAWFAAWVDGSGMPVWAWAGLGLAAFLLLRGLFRRDDRSDLVGPPRAMRLGARPTPTPTQAARSDPPQRP
jgi:hypothetical protein